MKEQIKTSGSIEDEFPLQCKELHYYVSLPVFTAMVHGHDLPKLPVEKRQGEPNTIQIVAG